MEHLINYFILFLYILHLLQLFNVGILVLLKRIVAVRTDAVFDLILIAFHMLIEFQYLFKANYKY